MRLLAICALGLLVIPTAAQEMPAAFNKCRACHEVGEGAPNKAGPKLNGVVDQPAGGVVDYSYSQALLAARDGGLVWTREALTQYLKRPSHMMPGTIMTFAGMTNRAEIDAIIDYMAIFASDGTPTTP